MGIQSNDERLREEDDAMLEAMIEYLIEGNDPRDMAIMLLEHMSDDEHESIKDYIKEQALAERLGHYN